MADFTAFGSIYYGAFSSVGQFLGIISAFLMGIPGASRLELYKLLSISDNEGISKVVKATQKYSKKVSVISTLITIIQFSWFSDVKLLNRKYVIFFRHLIWTVITMTLVVGVCSALKLGNVEYIDNWGKWILDGLGVFLISASMTVISTIIFYRKDLHVILNKVKVALFARNKS